jgi:hypothetical protein
MKSAGEQASEVSKGKLHKAPDTSFWMLHGVISSLLGERSACRKGGLFFTMSLVISRVHPLHSLVSIEQLFSGLPLLQSLFEEWDSTDAKHLAPSLMLREQVLGAGTLPGTVLQLFYHIAATHLHHVQDEKGLAHWQMRPLHQRLVRHVSTRSAEETQTVLPPRVLVQKTVTMEMDGKLILCSGVGAQPVTRRHLHTLAAKLSLSRRATKRCSLNPITYDPVGEFEMLPGMVSPFLRPRRPTRLAAVVFLPWHRHWEEQGYEVAISLSLWESFLLPLRCLKAVLCSYASYAYPDLPVVELQPPAQDDHEERHTGSSHCCFAGGPS